MYSYILQGVGRKKKIESSLVITFVVRVFDIYGCRSERLCCAKDEKVIFIRPIWSLMIYCDETYEIKRQSDNNLFFKKRVFKTFRVLYRIVGHLGGRFAGRWSFRISSFSREFLDIAYVHLSTETAT